MSTHTVNSNTLFPIPLSWEPCGAYDADHECEVGTCVRCGWPGAEHRAETGDRGYAHAA